MGQIAVKWAGDDSRMFVGCDSVVSGHDLDPRKVERAIKLSEEKYCSVAATIRGVTEITHDFEVLPAA